MPRPTGRARSPFLAAAAIALAAAVAAACSGAAVAPPSPDPVAAGAPVSPTATSAPDRSTERPSPTMPGPSPTMPSASRPPDRGSSASPEPADVAALPSPTAAASGLPAVPPADVWSAVAATLDPAGARLRVSVAGPSPGELRFERSASSTVVGGKPLFVCRDGRASDGQAAWTAVPGSWTCGAAALVAGFRTMGQPVDAWSAALPLATGVAETVRTLPDGRWEWRLAGSSAVFGGAIRVTAVVDPASGRLVSATRTDPTGTTTYAFDYGASFPPIAVPSR